MYILGQIEISVKNPYHIAIYLLLCWSDFGLNKDGNAIFSEPNILHKKIYEVFH